MVAASPVTASFLAVSTATATSDPMAARPAGTATPSRVTSARWNDASKVVVRCAVRSPDGTTKTPTPSS